MRAIKKARKLIESDPGHRGSVILSKLVIALESGQSFMLNDLYELDYKTFELALEVLSEWRLDRYYASKARLLDLSVHLSEMPAQGATGPDR